MRQGQHPCDPVRTLRRLASGLWVEGWRRNAPPQWHCVFNFHDLSPSFPSVSVTAPVEPVIDDLLHYAPNQAARIALLEALPAAFSDPQLAACLLTAQCASKLENDRFLEHGGRDCLGGARIPSVLARLLAHLVPKPAVARGRV